MSRIVWCVVLLSVCISLAYGMPKDQITKKALGDLTGDGRPEVAVETKIAGVSSNATDVVIRSNGKNIFKIPKFFDSFADGYCITGDRIAAWYRDGYLTESKWDPYYYDIVWYKYSRKLKRFAVDKEGFTRKAYPDKIAKNRMRELSNNPTGEVILSKSATFSEDARVLVRRKFGNQIYRISEMIWYKEDGNHGKKFYVENGDDASGSRVVVVATFKSDGTKSAEIAPSDG